MILCEEPYLNEPGWAASGGSPASHACKMRYSAYAGRITNQTPDSANVRRMVVKTAVWTLFCS